MPTEQYSHLKMFSFLRSRAPQVLLVLVFSLVAGLLDGVALSLIFPILQDSTGGQAPAYPFPFDAMAGFFSSFPPASRLRLVAVLLVAVTALRGVMVYATTVLSSRIQMVVIRHFRLRCLDEMFRMGLSSYNRRQAADFQLVVEGYTESTAGSIVGLLGTALPQVFSVIMLVGCLLFLSWKLTLAALVVVFLASASVVGVTRRIAVVSATTYAARATFSRMLRDIINGMKIIRLFHREAAVAQKFDDSVTSFNAARYRGDKLVGVVAPVFELIGVGILAVVLALGSWFIVPEQPGQLGVLLGFLVIMARIVTPIKALSQARASIAEKLPSLHALWQLLQPDGKEYPSIGTHHFDGLRDRIEFRDIRFAYDESDRTILNDVSLTIPRGSKIGIVGASGSGKSTLTELLLRFYDPQEGAILVDGRDLRSIEVGSWRERIGVVSQDVFLFDDTVAANIAFARPDATEQELVEAARRGYADEFIRRLPDGYQTRVGDRGVFLSAGQRQRLAIARSVLKDPEILVFDEATSALDSESERYVQTALNQLGQGRTVIAVAHRLATIADSDQIFVVEAGRVVERGTHLELLSRGGAYARLVKLQEMASA